MRRDSTAPTWLSSLLLFAAGIAVAFLYQQPPTLGDDIEYWGLGLDLHQGVVGAWQTDSFHDLRWPVWGVCWVLQGIFGYSAWSYFLEPAVYLAAGAVLIFHTAAKVGLTTPLRWASAILFLFHPLLDPSLGRPMPDLSEGFWVATAFFLWLHVMEGKSFWPRVGLTVLVGVALTFAQANRITGVFAIPVLCAGTLLLYPRKLGWLVLCGFFAALFVFTEAAIYHHLTDDWLHSYHANLGARGRKGTEGIPLWQLPFRFLPLLWRNPQEILFSILATLGFGLAVWKGGRTGRALALYAAVYYLTYNCALQSFSPPRPLVRDGERFLASLAFPLSILSAFGIQGIGLVLARISPLRPALRRVALHPVISLIILAIAVGLFSDRGHGEKNYLPEIAARLEATPAGTKIYSHDIMRYVAMMANPRKTQQLQWELDSAILDPSPAGLAKAEASDQIWLIRKHAWIRNRKLSETGRSDQLSQLAPYLTPPMKGWTIAFAGAKGDVPDFLFLKKDPGAAQDPVAENLIRGILPFALPWKWDHPGTKKLIEKRWSDIPLPPDLRGKNVFLWFKYASDRTEPIRLRLEFYTLNGDVISSLLFKPYFFPESSPDFFAIAVPPEAEKMALILRIDPRTTWIRLDDWKALTFP